MTKPILGIAPTKADLTAIDHMVDAIGSIQTKLPATAMLVSPITGECVTNIELGRCVGILTGLRDNLVWEIK